MQPLGYMAPKPVSFRQIDAPSEATPEVAREVQIVDTYGFEIVEETSPVPPANLFIDVVPFAATLRRIA